MVLYLCRDYLSQNTTTNSRTYITSYLVAIFLRRILGYTYVGDTNYPINAVGSLLIATGDTTPTVAPTFPGGNKAGINFGGGANFEVSIPLAIRTVVSGDIGRLLVLKSTRYPRYNSGIFVITGINAGSNRYVIDYRANSETPPPEAADSIEWYLYEKDLNCPTVGSGNGSATGYNSVGSSATPRIILQSPHALGWQVRICNESLNDNSATNFNGVIAPITFTPGFGGDAAGDFPIGGEALHTSLFYDIRGSNPANDQYYCGNGTGDSIGAGPQYRYTIIGDDTGQSVSIIARRPNNATSPRSFYMAFGVPDNEPLPLPITNIQRLFVLGNTKGDTGNGSMNDVSLAVCTNLGTGIQGAAFHRAPITCHPSLLAYVTGNNQLAGPLFDAQGGDCPFVSATELMPIDLTVGMIQTWNSSNPIPVYPLFPRVIGQLPIVKSGRANFGNYTLTTDNASWTVTGATNASPIQITTSVAHSLATGQMVAIHSVGGNAAANGTFTVTVTGANTFTLDGSTGSGAYTSGGTVLRGASWQHMRNAIFIPWNGPAVVP